MFLTKGNTDFKSEQFLTKGNTDFKSEVQACCYSFFPNFETELF